MQNQQRFDDAHTLKREDEIRDISQMPKEQLDQLKNVKPYSGQTTMPASQHSTMQSVSMGEVPATGHEENNFGSVASIHDQMQPGSFMSPISDRKSGSIENLSQEERPAGTEQGIITQGIEAVKDALYFNKEERDLIKEAIKEEAHEITEGASRFVQKTVETIEGMIHSVQAFTHKAADKVGEVMTNIEKDLGTVGQDFKREANEMISSARGAGEEAGQTIRAVGKSAKEGTADMKVDLMKRSYLVRKSMRRNLGKARREGEIIQKRAAEGLGFARVYAHEEFKDLKRRARRFRKDWKSDRGAAKDTLKAEGKSLQAKAEKVGAQIKLQAIKAKNNLMGESSDLKGQAEEAKVELKGEAQALKGKAQSKAYELRGEVRRQARGAKQGLKEEGGDLMGQARKYEREFREDTALIQDYLREKTSYARQGARRLLNQISRSAGAAKVQLQQAAGELMGQAQGQQESAGLKSNGFLLEFSAHDWNTGVEQPTGQRFDRSSDNADSKSFLIDIPASEWNWGSEQAYKQRANFLMTRAQGWMNKASQHFNEYQKELKSQTRDLQKDGRRLYNKASQKAGQAQNIARDQINQIVDNATQRLGDASNKMNQPQGQPLKQQAQGWYNQAAEKATEIMGSLDETKDKAMRYVMEKKSDLQFQAELLSTPKMPTQEAIQKKAAINEEIRSHTRDSQNKENIDLL